MPVLLAVDNVHGRACCLIRSFFIGRGMSYVALVLKYVAQRYATRLGAMQNTLYPLLADFVVVMIHNYPRGWYVRLIHYRHAV